MSPGTVIVGAGLGGVRTAERMRRNGYRGEITLVGAERHTPYDRPPLTKQVLRGERESTPLRKETESLQLRTLLGRSACRLDASTQRIELDDGTELPYSSAVLATGGRPRAIPGIAPRHGLHAVRTIDDALALRAAVTRSGAVTVIGAGFIGCEVAASLRMTGAEVDLVETLPHPLARVLGQDGGKLVETHLRKHGIRIHTGVALDQLQGADRVTGAVLTDGTVLHAPEVVAGLGIEPSLGWLDGSGIRIGDGIVCDAAGRTSLPNVFAVGDAANWYHPQLAEHRRVEHWTTTVDQATTVAAAITGQTDAELREVPYFWSDQFDIKIQALGFIEPNDTAHRLDLDGRTLLLYTRNDLLRGVVGFSAARHVMRLRALLATGGSLDDAINLLGHQ